MLTIGRFADATGLTAKALRHYDEIGLLVPARVDPDNGYRYYDPAQVEDAVTIRRLRALELPLDEIKDLLLGIEPLEPPVALFRGGDGDGTHLVEVGFPVAQGIEGDDVLRVRRYAGATAATVEHTGSYDGLHLTAQRFIASVLGEGLRPGQPIRIEFVQYHVLARIVWPLAAS